MDPSGSGYVQVASRSLWTWYWTFSYQKYFWVSWLDFKLFIGLWKFHIDLLLHKLGAACYGVRKLSHVLERNVIKSAHFACFHLLIRYFVLFWGYSTNANKIFLLQNYYKNNMGVALRCSYKGLFKKLDILPSPCEDELSLLMFITKIFITFWLALLFME